MRTRPLLTSLATLNDGRRLDALTVLALDRQESSSLKWWSLPISPWSAIVVEDCVTKRARKYTTTLKISLRDDPKFLCSQELPIIIIPADWLDDREAACAVRIPTPIEQNISDCLFFENDCVRISVWIFFSCETLHDDLLFIYGRAIQLCTESITCGLQRVD